MSKSLLTREERFERYMTQYERKSHVLQHCVRSFWVGGVICAIGQGISMFGESVVHLEQPDLGAFTSIVLVFLAALLTGLGVYDQLGSYAGAGSVLPITGFANFMVAPAIEFKREGYVLGVGAKMFILAGPVLVYGITASWIAGLLYFFGWGW